MTKPVTSFLDSVHFNDINLTDYQNGTNNTDFLTNHTRPPTWSLEYVILAVMVTALAVNGLIGNTSVLIVYFRRRENLASNTFIKVLASVDLLAFVMPYTIIYELHMVTSDFICRFCELILHFCIFASNITLVAVATERYIAVCQISTKVDTHSISVGIWVILGLSTALGAPSIATFSVVQSSEVHDIKCQFPHEYTSGTFCHFTYSIMGKTLVTVYQGLSALLFYVSVIMIVVLYSIVYYVLWKKTKTRRKMLSQTPRSREMESISEISSSDQQRASRVVRLQLDGRPSCAYRPDITIHNEDISRVVMADSRVERQSDPKHTKGSTDEVIDNIGVGSANKIVRSTSTEYNNKVITTTSSESTNKLINNTSTDVTNENINTSSADSTDININTTGAVSINTVVNNTVSKPRRKIRFSVSAKSGRSEKVKRKRYYHRRTAKMLFLCTIIYFVTWLPFWIDVFGFTNCLLLRYIFFIGNATNPIVYGVVNEQVRRAFKKLFLDCLKKWFRVGTPDTSDYFLSSRLSASSLRETSDK